MKKRGIAGQRLASDNDATEMNRNQVFPLETFLHAGYSPPSRLSLSSLQFSQRGGPMKQVQQFPVTATLETPLGRLLVAATADGISRLEFADSAPVARSRHPHI